MKKNRLKFGIFIIIIVAIATIVIAKFCLLNDLKDNSTFYEFVASVIIAVVTTIYVLLTYEIVDTNTELLKESKKEREALEKQIELMKRTLVIPELLTVGSANIDLYSAKVSDFNFAFDNIRLINVSNLPAINLKVYCFIKQVYATKNEYFTSSVINHLKPGEEKNVEQRAKYKLKDENIESIPDRYPFLKDEVKRALDEYKEKYAGTIIIEYYDSYGEKNFVKRNIILSSISEYIWTEPVLIKEN